jgi:GT2 family glycosyltransferase
LLPALSIVIPSHQRTDLLRACLASVCQHAPAGTQIIVVDDGSCARRVSAVADEFPSVECLRLARRRGFCRAANAGIQAARGEIVELLNDDTEVTVGWADAALNNFADATVAAVAPLVLGFAQGNGAARIDSAGDRYYLGGVAGKRGHGQALQAEYLRAGPVFGASGSSGFFRRDVLRRVGALPEQFGAYFEDVDLAFRLHRAGHTVLFEPRSRVFHHVSASYGRRRRALLEQQSLNEERVFWRNLTGPALGAALPRHMAVLAAKAWKRWQEGGLVPFLCGRFRVLGETRELYRHRRWLQTLGPARDVDCWLVERVYWGDGNGG